MNVCSVKKSPQRPIPGNSLHSKMSKLIPHVELGYILDQGSHYTCGTCGKILSKRKYVVERHYLTQHQKNIKDGESNRRTIYTSMVSREEYIRNTVEIFTSANTPFSFWDNPAWQFNQMCYTEAFGVACSAETMKSHLQAHYWKNVGEISEELQDKLISIKYNIAPGRSGFIMGISAQYTLDWQIQVRKLGMIILSESQSEMELREKITTCLDTFVITKDNIIVHSYDDGSNILHIPKNSTEDAGDSSEETSDRSEGVWLEDLDLDNSPEEIKLKTLSDNLKINISMERIIGADMMPGCWYCISSAATRFFEEYQSVVDELMESVSKVRSFIRELPPEIERCRIPCLGNIQHWSSMYYMVGDHDSK